MRSTTALIDGEPGRVEALQQTVSASRLSLFIQCRLRFFFRYVLKLEKPKAPALHVGSSVHSALKAWNKARWRKTPLTGEQLQQAFLLSWQNEEHAAVQWDEDEEKHRNIAWGLVETYLRETPIPLNSAPDAVEVPVEADLSGHGLPRLIGVLDLVQSGTIVEFKTAASTPDPARATHIHEVQTTGYGILYREATGRNEAGLELHTLVKTKTPKLVVITVPPVTEEKKSRFFRLIESYLSGVQREDWVPSPGFQCSACEYFRECRQWS